MLWAVGRPAVPCHQLKGVQVRCHVLKDGRRLLQGTDSLCGKGLMLCIVACTAHELRRILAPKLSMCYCQGYQGLTGADSTSATLQHGSSQPAAAHTMASSVALPASSNVSWPREPAHHDLMVPSWSVRPCRPTDAHCLYEGVTVHCMRACYLISASAERACILLQPADTLRVTPCRRRGWSAQSAKQHACSAPLRTCPGCQRCMQLRKSFVSARPKARQSSPSCQTPTGLQQRC